jgi:phytoene dehydrogenase-like protein
LTFYNPNTGPAIGVAIPSKLDSSLAAHAGSAMTIVSLIPNSDAKKWDRNAPDYASRKKKFMQQLIDTATQLLPDLRSHIVYKEAATPATFSRYTSSSDGSIYGPKLGQTLPFKSPIRNMYLVGSGTFPGAGIEAVVISALITANDILPKSPEFVRVKRVTKESEFAAPLLAEVPDSPSGKRSSRNP